VLLPRVQLLDSYDWIGCSALATGRLVVTSRRRWLVEVIA